MDNFREWVSDNLRYILLGLAVVLIIVLAVVGIRFISGLGDNDPTPGESESRAVAETESQSEAETSSALVQNEPAVLELVQNYYTAVQNKDIETLRQMVESLDEQDQQAIENNDLIESYNNISVYSKNGPVQGSYVVYACYDGKLVGYNTMVPSLTYLYVCTDEDGSLYVADQDSDDTVKAYIEQMNQEADVTALADDVAQKCAEAEASDPELAAYLKSLEVPETESVIPDSSQAGVEVNKLVQAKEACNIRADSTEDAEVIGALNPGDTITRIRALDNGWSEVRMSDGSGYIRSDLLTEEVSQ